MSEFTNKVPEAANITEIDDNISEKIHRNIKISQDNTREELLQKLKHLEHISECLEKSKVELEAKNESVLSEIENEKRLRAETLNILALLENMAVTMVTHMGEVEKNFHRTTADRDEIRTKSDNIKLEIINMKKSYEQFVRTTEAGLSEYSRGLEKYQGHMDKMTNFICVRDIHVQQADEIISDHQILLQELRAQIQEKACEMEKVEHDRNMLQQLCDLAEKELQMIRTLEDYKQRLNINVTASENKNTERNTSMLAVEGEIQAARDKIVQMQDETNALQMNSLSLSDEQLINYRFENIEIENNTAERNSNVERLVDELQIKEKDIPKLEMTLKKRKLQAAAEDSIKKTRQEIVNLSGKIEKSKNEKAERERQINELQIKINNIERALSAANKEVHVEPGDVIEQPEHPRTPTDTTHILQTNQH